MKQRRMRAIALAGVLGMTGALHMPLMANDAVTAMDEIIVRASASEFMDVSAPLEEVVAAIREQNDADLRTTVQIELAETFGTARGILVAKDNLR